MKNKESQTSVKDIREILKNNIVKDHIRYTLDKIFDDMNLPLHLIVTEEVLRSASSYKKIEEYEKDAHDYLQGKGIGSQTMFSRFDGRADLIYSQIKEHLPKSGSVLDIGCGDGKVGEKIFDSGLEVALADVYKHANIELLEQKGLKYIKLEQDKNFNNNTQYDTILLLTVLHHSNDPDKTLQEAKNLLKDEGNIIIKESVYGITDNSDFGKLNTEEQRLSNIFFDHFYNRILHYSDKKENKVNVPFNFYTLQGLEKLFEQNGLEQKTITYLGIEESMAPEYHTLHVVKKK